MKCLHKVLTAALLAALLATSCASTSSPSAAPATTPASAETTSAVPAEEPEPTAVAEEQATTVAPSELTNQEKTAAAIAAFEANPEPAELFAWDHLGADVNQNEVTLQLCSWSGDSVFDEVRLVSYIVTAGDDGEPSVRFNFSNTTADDCLNTELINSALAFTREYETYWGAVLDDPAVYDPERSAELKTPELVANNRETVDQWVRDGLHWRGHSLDSSLPASVVNDILERRFTFQGQNIFELLACRTMNADYGLYRGQQLVEDDKGENPGEQSIDKYQLARSEGQWILVGTDRNVWGDCVNTEPTWLEGVNEWQPEPVPWKIMVHSDED